MTPELTALALAGLLQVVQFALMSVTANLDLGPRKTLSARDESYRAFNNHFEGLIMFTLAVVVVELSGQNSAFTAACAYAYLIARVAYVPAYYFGLAPWRSLIWFVGFGASVLMLISTLI